MSTTANSSVTEVTYEAVFFSTFFTSGLALFSTLSKAAVLARIRECRYACTPSVCVWASQIITNGDFRFPYLGTLDVVVKVISEGVYQVNCVVPSLLILVVSWQQHCWERVVH